MNTFYKFLLGALESKVETLVGDKAFAELYKIREEAELKEVLLAKTRAAEKRWRAEHADHAISVVVSDHDLLAEQPAIQVALRALVDNPRPARLAEAVLGQLNQRTLLRPEVLPAVLAEAADAYAAYTLDELFLVEGLSENLTALAQRATTQNTAETNVWLQKILVELKDAPPAAFRLPPPPVLVVHAKGDEALAAQLAQPLAAAGYDPQTELLAENVLPAARPALEKGGLVVLCATLRAMGGKWAGRLLEEPRLSASARVLVVQLEEDVAMEDLDNVLTECWRDPTQTADRVLEFAQRYYSLRLEAAQLQRGDDAEARYRKAVLEECDIVKINNLPQPDKEVALRQLQLRRLYIPLRAWVDVRVGEELDEATAQALEERRTAAMRLTNPEAAPRIERQRAAIGDRLKVAHRLVILGDPGAGKTTLTLWFTTAYLLRGDTAWRELPDVQTLPDVDLLPVIIRLRDFGGELPDTLDELLRHALRKTQLPETEVDALHPVVRARIQRGEALLMFDGLDEINNPAARVKFCQQLETIHTTYPHAFIIATSRIVGYNEMGYRLGRGFEHLTLADLEREEKDDFARRWCDLTEPPTRRAPVAEELIKDIHSSDRIERLTGNPMLLTTMALVKRKVGKLPSRRADLYREAVEVLLNWRPEVDAPLEWREAVPQLAYVAYAMCHKGVQRLTETEISTLLTEMRLAYPNLHLVKQRTPEEFLKLVEARTGLLIEAGHEKQLGMLEPVFEFRHLTFQEYMAARALVDGVFPARDPNCSLAQNIAPLAGRTQEATLTERGQKEIAVVESWREALRLCISFCNKDDVDPALQAILTPLPGEPGANARARAIMAVLCLADEPENVSEAVAQKVFQAFAAQSKIPDGEGSIARTNADVAVREMTNTRWVQPFSAVLAQEFCQHSADERGAVGGLCAMIQAMNFPDALEAQRMAWEAGQQALNSNAPDKISTVALLIMFLAYEGRLKHPSPVEAAEQFLPHLLSPIAPVSHAVAWALGWLNDSKNIKKLGEKVWHPTPAQVDILLKLLANPNADVKAIQVVTWIVKNEKIEAAAEGLIKHWLFNVKSPSLRKNTVNALGALNSDRVVEPLIACLSDTDAEVRRAVVEALGTLKSDRAVEPLIACLSDPEEQVRRAVANALGTLKSDRAVGPLIVCLSDPEAQVRQTVAYALGDIESDRAVEPLIACLSDPEEQVRRAVAKTLGTLKNDRAVDPLIERLNGSDAEVRRLVAQVLGDIGSDRAVDPLIERLNGSDAEVRRLAVQVLGKIGSDRAVDPLIVCLSDPEAQVRQTVAYALGDIESDRAVEPLLARLSDSDIQVRQTALRALAAEDTDRKLVSRDLDGIDPFLDPQAPIPTAHAEKAAQEINIPLPEVLTRYEALARRLDLKLEWQPPT